MDEALVNSLAITTVGVSGAGVLTFIGVWFWRGRDSSAKAAEALAAANAALVARVAVLERDAAASAATLAPVVGAFQAKMIEMLTHDEHLELDGLLAKTRDNTLLPEEEPRVLELLAARANDPDPLIGDQERAIARFFPTLAQMANLEHRIGVAVTKAENYLAVPK